jgi:hypothetical protein
MKRKTQSKKLFISTGDLSDVVLNWYGQSIEKLDLYSEAYHSTARLLIEKSSDDQLRDIGACPAVFLYRLSLELSLKAVLISGSKILQLRGEPFNAIKEILNRGHILSELLADFKALCKQLDGKWGPQRAAIGEIIAEFHEKDPLSFCFRYPVKKSGEPALGENFRFDLSNFCARMDEVLEFLDQFDCGLAGRLDEMQEAALDRY